jgi:transposase
LGILPQLADRVRRTGKKIILVLDNGSAHTSKRSKAALGELNGKIEVFWLPPYTSEQLNDIESLWKHLKEDFFSRMLTHKAEEFSARVVELLTRFRPVGAIAQMNKLGHAVSVRKNLALPA